MPAIKGKPNYNRRRRVVLTCSVCNKKYEQHKYRSNNSKYCSKKCWSKRAPNKICLNCGKIYNWKIARGEKYCSRDCAKKHMKGIHASAWKDGKSLKKQRARAGEKIYE